MTVARTAGFALLYVIATYVGRLTVMDGTNLSMRNAVSTVIPPLASTMKNSPGRLSASDASMRAASSAGSSPAILTDWPR